MQYFDPVQLGNRIKKIRELKEMKQIDLATLVGYTSERQIQRIEAGESGCSIDKLVELSQVLNVSTDYLLFGIEKEIPQSIHSDLQDYITNKSLQEQAFALTVLKSIFDNKQLLVS